MKKFHIHTLSPRAFNHTVVWSVVMSALIVVLASMLARATHNFSAAVTDKPDVAVYILLPDEEIGRTTLLQETEFERDYLAETKDGPKLIKLKKGEEAWYVALIEKLHE